MIKLLAPTTAESADDHGASVIIELDQDTFRGLAAAVEVAYDDPESTPPEYADAARDLWAFFHAQAPE